MSAQSISILNRWKGILSVDSILMSKKGAESGSIQLKEESLGVILPAAIDPQSKECLLLEKMMNAIGMQNQEWERVAAGDLKAKIFKYYLLLGIKASDVELPNAPGVIETHGLKEILSNPVLKKETWNELKKLGSLLGKKRPTGRGTSCK